MCYHKILITLAVKDSVPICVRSFLISVLGVTCTDLALTQADQVRFPNGLNANKKHVVDLSPASVGRLDANKRHLDLSSALVELCLASLPLVLGELGPVLVLGELGLVEMDSSRRRGSARGKLSSWQSSYLNIVISLYISYQLSIISSYVSEVSFLAPLAVLL